MCVKEQKGETTVTNIHLYVLACLLMVPSRRQVTIVSRGSVSYLPRAICQLGFSAARGAGTSLLLLSPGIPPFSSPLRKCSFRTHGQAALRTLKGHRDALVNYCNAELSEKFTQLKDSRSLCKGFRDEKREAGKLLSQDNFTEPWSQMP